MYEDCMQIVMCTVLDRAKPQASITLLERKLDCFTPVLSHYDCLIGKNGLAQGMLDFSFESLKEKKEGDLCAPAGIFPITKAFGLQNKNLSIPFIETHPFLEYIDDPKSMYYNMCVDVRDIKNKDWQSSEKMVRDEDPLYHFGLIVGYNEAPVRPGRGSCIFIHRWQDSMTPSSGCTVMNPDHLDMIAQRLEQKKNPMLLQGTYEYIQKLSKKLHLHL
jgi:L,D-peptidoglycan transpeptidase YkuD (ErfK/YbiS/YcfS/YnhG family)